MIEIFPASYTASAIRVELFGDEVERIVETDIVTGEVLSSLRHAMIFPASHYVTEPDKMQAALAQIGEELEQRLADLRSRKSC